MSNTAEIVNIEEHKKIVKVDIDNGFDKVARELTDVLANPPIKLSAREYQFIFAVISKTYRFKKKVDWASSAQLSEITGIDISNISRVKTALISKNVIICEGRKFGINTKIYEWVNIKKQSKTTKSKNAKTVKNDELLVKNDEGTVKNDEKTVENDNNNRESINTIEYLTIEECNEDKTSMQESKVFISLPLNKKNTFHDVTFSDISDYKELFPSASVELQLRKMVNWLNDNPKRRKTSQGIRRFITSWLQREQDKPKRKDEVESQLFGKNDDLDLESPSWIWE